MYNGPQSGNGNIIAMEELDDAHKQSYNRKVFNRDLENKKENYMELIFAQIANLAGEKIKQSP